MDEDYCQNFCAEYKVSLLWKIRDLRSKCQKCKKGDYLSSPKYYVAGNELIWNMQLDYTSDSERVTVLLLSSKQRNTFFTCELALIGNSGQKMFPKTFCKSFDGLPYKIYLTSWCKLLDNEAQLLPNDELTISCVLSATTKTETIGKVTRNVSELLSEPPTKNSLVDDFARFFADDTEANRDVLLKVGGCEMAVHKTVLMCRSPVFASMLERDMLDRCSSQVDITDVDFDVLGEMVRFMYTDVADFRDVHFSLKLLTAADTYDVLLLITRCSEYLQDHLSLKNVFDILSVANSCSQHELCENCMDLIKDQMSSVSLLKDWIAKLYSNPEVLSVIDEHLRKNDFAKVDKL